MLFYFTVLTKWNDPPETSQYLPHPSTYQVDDHLLAIVEELDVEVFGAGLLVVVAVGERRRRLVAQVRVLGPEQRYRTPRL